MVSDFNVTFSPNTTSSLGDSKIHNHGPYEPLHNVSDFVSISDYQLYIKAYNDFNQFVISQRRVRGIINFTFGIFGIFGSLMTVATLYKNKNFESNCFIVYQCIAISNLFYMIVNNVLLGLYNANLFHYSAIASLVIRRISIFANVNAYFTGLLIIFLSVERAVACLLPTKYHYLERRWIYIAVIIGSLLFSCVLGLPAFFQYSYIFNLATGIYLPVLSWSHEADNIYNATTQYYSIIEAALVLMSTVLSVAGLIKSVIIK
jgi:hypothetical protein